MEDLDTLMDRQQRVVQLGYLASRSCSASPEVVATGLWPSCVPDDAGGRRCREFLPSWFEHLREIVAIGESRNEYPARC